MQRAAFDFKGATLYAYDPLLPAVPMQIIQENVSTMQGGFGVLEEIIYDNTKVYFLEYQPENWSPIYGSYETMEQDFYPTEDRVILEDGTMRFPVVIEGIQSQLGNIELELHTQGANGEFPMHYLYNYEYEFIAGDLFPINGEGNSYTFGYGDNFFYVKFNSGQESEV